MTLLYISKKRRQNLLCQYIFIMLFVIWIFIINFERIKYRPHSIQLNN